jgi:hypothetical protein
MLVPLADLEQLKEAVEDKPLIMVVPEQQDLQLRHILQQDTEELAEEEEEALPLIMLSLTLVLEGDRSLFHLLEEPLVLLVVLTEGMEIQIHLQQLEFLQLVLVAEEAVAELRYLEVMEVMVDFQRQAEEAEGLPTWAHNQALVEAVQTGLQLLLLTFNLWIITTQFLMRLVDG